MEKNDRTWTLNVKVYHDSENVSDDVKIRVRGNYSIGHVMALIVQEVGGHNDWSDYAIWWPEKKRWLKNCQMTLDQVDVCAGNSLEFRTMHQTLQIQFPDLNVQELKVDFSVNVLQAVMKLCQMIEINHPEEWSLARPLTNQQLKQNNHHLSASPLQRYPAATISRTQKSSNNHNHNNNNNNIYNNNTINHSNGSLLSQKSYATISSNGSSINDSNHSLTGTNNPSNNDLKQTFKLILPHPKTSIEKARLNSAWLNSSISLFEQDVCENDLLLLRIKYYTFYDLKPTELSRINYIYENLKLNILQEEISCNEDEMYTMAGIMLQVGYCSGQNDRFSTTTTFNQNGNGLHHHHNHGHINNGSKCFNNNNNNNNNGSLSTISSSTSSNNDIDEVDCALETLEKELQTTSLTNELSNRRVRMLTIPQLNGELKITCQNMNGISTLARIKSTLSGDRRYFAIFKETTLYAYRPQDCDEHSRNPAKEPEIILNMINCEIRPNVMASQQRFCFQIIDSKNRNVNYLIKCSNEDQYARWFAACKQASLGHTMAHPSYNEQYNDTLKLLKIQSKVSKTPKSINKQELKNSEIDLQQFISPRFLKRRSKEQILAKIKTASEMFSDNSLIEAQMNFIKFCQKLTDYAITLFVVRFHKSKKEDLLGAMPDKLVLIDINNGSLRKTWRYKTMINWNINWEVKRMSINFRDETLEFECISADCKVIHEFIGGYIYMSMRGNQINDGFNEEQFLKLTGGWNDDDLQNEDDEDDHIAMCRREAWANLHHGLMVK